MKIKLNPKNNRLVLEPETAKEKTQLRKISNQMTDNGFDQSSVSVMGKIQELQVILAAPNN